jgi:hypothetical protein
MRILLALMLLVCVSAQAADRITASLIVTNTPTNGMTITINGSVRTWTNSVIVSSSQILTNPVTAQAKTNLYNQVALNQITSVNEQDKGATNIDYIGASGVPLTVTLSAGWGQLTYATQTVSSGTALVTPYTGFPAVVRTNMVSGAVAMIDADASTNVIRATAPAVSATLVGISNAQTVVGAKVFSSSAGVWRGNVSNGIISGTITTLTNGTWRNGFLSVPTFTNAVNYGSAISSPGAAAGSEQFGLDAVASKASSLAVGNVASASEQNATALGPNASVFSGATNGLAVGQGAISAGANSIAIGFSSEADGSNSVAIGVGVTASLDNQIRLGSGAQYLSVAGLQVDGGITNAHFSGTNQFPAESDIAFARKALTTLANGINQDIIVGTNIFIQVSGPGAAFSIEGIAGGRDGKYLIILNKTGFDMTIACEGGATGNDPVAANRIITMTAADKATTGNGAAILIYSASESRWQLIGIEQ